MKAFIISQFSYFPLIWMLHSKILNNRINNIHERALGLTYNLGSESNHFTHQNVKTTYYGYN